MQNKVIKPMLLKEISVPPQDKKYLYELKFDGIRAIIYVSPTFFKILSRNGKNITNAYPELVNIKKLVNELVIFDGEIVAFKNRIPNFNELQKRSSLKNKNKIIKAQYDIPVAFIAFDILYKNHDLMNYPLINRKKILNKYADNNVFIKSKIYYDGLILYKKVIKLGMEGIVAKNKNSPYISGQRTDNWLKIKNLRQEYFYIHGFITLKTKISLLLGEFINSNLRYVGKVSIAPTNSLVKKLLIEKKVANMFINENINATYIKPKIKILVKYLERTENNHLRQAFINIKQ